MAHLTSPYEQGRRAGRLRLAFSLNPFGAGSRDAAEWERGWIRSTGELLREAATRGEQIRARLSGCALVLPHPAMTAVQCEQLCAREGLALAHLGQARLMLVQTSAPKRVELRIARPDPEAA